MICEFFDHQWREGDHQEATRVLELHFSLKARLPTRVISLVVVRNLLHEKCQCNDVSVL